MSTIHESPGQAAWRRLTSQKTTVLAMVFLVFLIILCAFGPMFSPYTEASQDLKLGATGPSAAHWLGTDSLGRDLFTRLMYGGRMSLLVGAVATFVAMVIGVGYGLVSGLSGPRIDSAMMRFVDILYAFPFMTFVILLKVTLGGHALDPIFARIGMHNFDSDLALLFAAIGAVEWLTMARVVRGQVLALKNQEFITAARSYGALPQQILLRHLLPNVSGSIVIYASLTVPGVMLLEATLSFLGLGVQPPFASWGVLIGEGAIAIQSYPWLLLGPGLFFCSTLLALNTLGDALRDALDPKSVVD
jgi:oligopeptide transport system permease protein